MYAEEDFLLISGIQHFLFCKRQWALIHVEQQWQENHLTLEGQHLHEKTDNPGIKEKRNEKIVVRAMPIFSKELGITGTCDVVEFVKNASGTKLAGYPGRYQVIPVEYKHGKKKYDLSDEMQIVAQAVCLEEMLATIITTGQIFYFETRRRETLEISADKRQILKDALAEMHQYWQKKYTPKVKRSAKCENCSIKDKCLPELDKRQTVNEYIQRMLRE